MSGAVDPGKERIRPMPLSRNFDSSFPLILDPWLSVSITVFRPCVVMLAYELFPGTICVGVGIGIGVRSPDVVGGAGGANDVLLLAACFSVMQIEGRFFIVAGCL